MAAVARHARTDAAGPLPGFALDRLFREARTAYAWSDEAVPETTIRALYDLVKMGPTSVNLGSARFLFIGSPEGKARLRPHLSAGNADKTMAAPWTAVVAWDERFHDRLPALFPPNPDVKAWFEPDAARAEHGVRNAVLQGAYLILAARALGLDAGPMSGFDKTGLDAEFFRNDPERANWRADFLVNLGHRAAGPVHPRLPRLAFDEAAAIL